LRYGAGTEVAEPSWPASSEGTSSSPRRVIDDPGCDQRQRLRADRLVHRAPIVARPKGIRIRPQGMTEVTDDPRIAGTRNETRDCLCIFRRYLKVVAAGHGENRDGNPSEDRHWVIVKQLAEPPSVHLLACPELASRPWEVGTPGGRPTGPRIETRGLVLEGGHTCAAV